MEEQNKKKRTRITRKITTKEAEKVNYIVEKEEENEEEVKKEEEKKEVEKKNYYFIKNMFKRNGRT